MLGASIMDFTELYKHTSSLVAFSPGAHFIITGVQDRLVVRRADSFQITRNWQIDASPSPTEAALAPKAGASSAKAKTNTPGKDPSHWITHVAWSCDSEFVLAACAKAGVVHVFKLRDEGWSARIDAGAEGRCEPCRLPTRCHRVSTGLVKAEWAPDGRNILCFSDWNVGGTTRFAVARSLEPSGTAQSNHLVSGDGIVNLHPVPPSS